MKCRERRHLKRQQLCPLNYNLIRRGPRQPLNHLLGFLGRGVKKQFQRCNPLWWCSPANTGLGEVYLWIQQCMTNNTLLPPWWVLNSFDGPSYIVKLPWYSLKSLEYGLFTLENVISGRWWNLMKSFNTKFYNILTESLDSWNWAQWYNTIFWHYKKKQKLVGS